MQGEEGGSMKKGLFLLVLLFTGILFSGCTGREMEEQLLVIILGVDVQEDGGIRIAIKVPSHSGSGGGGGENASAGGEQMGYLLLEATGKRFPDAVNLLRATTPRTLNFSQIREVAIGEKAAGAADFSTLLYSIYSLPRMRSQAALIICKDQAYDFVKEQKPYVGTRLSRYVETTLENYAGKGFIPKTTLGEAVRDLGYGFQDALLIYGAVNDFKKSQSPQPENILDARAGSLPRKSVNKIELFGAAATNGVSVSGILTGYEMGLIHLLNGDAQSLNIEADGANTPIFARAPATLSVDLSSHPAVLRIDFLCEGRYFPGYLPDETALIEKLTEDLQKLMARLQRLQCDGLGFGNLAARQCPVIRDWEQLSWRQQYEMALVEIHLELQLREY